MRYLVFGRHHVHIVLRVSAFEAFAQYLLYKYPLMIFRFFRPLFSYPPFYSHHFHSNKPSPGLVKQILTGDYSFNDPEWQTVSRDAKDLIKKMLETDPKKRLSIEQILQSKWVKVPIINQSIN